MNGATLTADRFGDADKAYSFNGVDNNIEIADSPELNFGVNPTFSISMWYTVNSLQPMGLLTKAQTSFLDPNVNGWNWKGFNFYLESGVGYIQHSAPCNGNISYSIDPLPNHLVMTIGNSLVKIFMNSVEILQFSCGNLTTETVSNNMPLFFGIDRDQFSHLNGTLDDIGIWNRALTADEVLALYNGCNVTPQVVGGNTTPGAFSNSTYTCNNNAGSTYTWAVNNGVIVSGQGTNSVTILWGAEGVGSISVSETTADGCVGDEVIYDVNVQCVVSGNEITGPVGPEAFSNSTYTCNGAANSTYNWTVTNGVIASGQGTNTVNILWASTGLGNVSVIETTAEGCVGTTLSQDVVVIPTNVEELSNAMILYPNPATTELNLQITSELIGTDLFVFDALGKQMLKQQILSTNTIINTSSFAAGNYVVKVGGGVKKFEVVR